MTDETEIDLDPRGNSKNDVVWAESSESVPVQELQNWAASVRLWAGALLGRRSFIFMKER